MRIFFSLVARSWLLGFFFALLLPHSFVLAVDVEHWVVSVLSFVHDNVSRSISIAKLKGTGCPNRVFSDCCVVHLWPIRVEL